MKESVLYTGTFDPFHAGHLRQLERAYRAHPFNMAVVAIIKDNPKKPQATDWRDRLALARLMLSEHQLPFEVELEGIDYIKPTDLTTFVAQHMTGYKVSRVVGSDSIVEFIEDRSLNDVLNMYHYLIVVRPLVGLSEVHDAIKKMPRDIAAHFSYKIVEGELGDFDIGARNIRTTIEKSLEQGLITRSQADFIKHRQLYQPH